MASSTPESAIAPEALATPRALAQRLRARRGLLLRLLGNKKACVGLIITLAVALVALFAPLLARYDPNAMAVGPLLSPPSAQHLGGTDMFGRDMLSRVLYGARLSLMVGLVVAGCSLLLGVPLGLLAGYYGGAVAGLIMRVIDVLFAFPWVLIALFLATVIGPGLQTVMLALILVYAPQVVRLTYGSTLSVREKEYVEAAIATGERPLSIVLRYILPNILSPLIVQGTLFASFAILSEASISYLGLGTQPPTPSWGLMLTDYAPLLEAAPYLSIYPGVAIGLTVLGLNLLGDGLRDVLDPRYREE